MSSRPKPEVLADGRIVEFSRRSYAGWSGHITEQELRPGVVAPEHWYMTMDSYPTVRALRAALKDGTAVFERGVERMERLGR